MIQPTNWLFSRYLIQLLYTRKCSWYVIFLVSVVSKASVKFYHIKIYASPLLLGVGESHTTGQVTGQNIVIFDIMLAKSRSAYSVQSILKCKT